MGLGPENSQAEESLHRPMVFDAVPGAGERADELRRGTKWWDLVQDSLAISICPCQLVAILMGLGTAYHCEVVHSPSLEKLIPLAQPQGDLGHQHFSDSESPGARSPCRDPRHGQSKHEAYRKRGTPP